MRESNQEAPLPIRYNLLPVGGVLYVERPTNTTLFKRRLEAKGLVERQDFVADSRGDHCIIRRLTLKPMN